MFVLNLVQKEKTSKKKISEPYSLGEIFWYPGSAIKSQMEQLMSWKCSIILFLTALTIVSTTYLLLDDLWITLGWI